MDIDFVGKLNLGIRGFFKDSKASIFMGFELDGDRLARGIDFHAIKLKSVIIQKTRNGVNFSNKIIIQK